MTDPVFRLETKWFTVELTREGVQVLVHGLGQLLISVVVLVVTGYASC